jgi:hypothetical protein
MRRGDRLKLLSVTLLALPAMSACGGEGDEGTVSPARSPAAERPASSAKLAIVEPQSGGVVDGETARVRLELTGAKITKAVTTNLRPDEGHMHIRLDGRTITVLGGLDENLAELSGRPLAAGPHLLDAEFVASDHGPFDPRVVASVPFRVK